MTAANPKVCENACDSAPAEAARFADTRFGVMKRDASTSSRPNMQKLIRLLANDAAILVGGRADQARQTPCQSIASMVRPTSHAMIASAVTARIQESFRRLDMD